ncbi:MAG TPA: 3-phosphoserine/phosphohydroxythreonine transaminase [Planctomycetaceae bacterium]|jgi:phosphoserine aminotransferase|nr:3-phosphoserine/phosphohydroxythreonine transaminase [Planctomycetaceae bacterium]|tara:strand:- start:688 stop:1779 length:1092 start_codon:yes stop_codon:yes gene_type:complete
MANRVFNFSAGPAGLPESVLLQAQAELLSYGDCGASIMEISHRSETFKEILDSARNGIRTLLAVGDDFDVLLIQGGSRLQFSMIPMNLASREQTADYVVSGAWSAKALEEAHRECDVHISWNGTSDGFDRLPVNEDLLRSEKPAFAYYCSNETIHGLQFPEAPDYGSVPLVCDASSDFLSRPVDMQRHGLIYACAQKNVGPAGLTVVVIRRDLLERSSDDLPGYLNFKSHSTANTMYNTPPTFAIYIMDLVCKWIIDECGGLDSLANTNREKAELLYAAIDRHAGFYSGHAQTASRSNMNVVFKLPSDELTQSFIEQAADHSLTSLAGHRSVGGIRASIYNAMPQAGVESLAGFMDDFANANG